MLLEKLGPTASFQALRRGLVADCTVVSDGGRGEVCLLGPVAGGIVDRLVDELLRETDSLRDRLDAALERSLSASLRDRGARPADWRACSEGLSDLLEAGLFDEGARGTDPAGR